MSGKYSSLKYLPVGSSGPISAYLAMRCPACSGVLVPWLIHDCPITKQKSLQINNLKAFLFCVDKGHFPCGEEGIRTLETLSSLHTFQACQFNHSCTSPFRLKNSNSGTQK